MNVAFGPISRILVFITPNRWNPCLLGKNAQPTLCNLLDYAGAHCSSLHSSICYREACISQNNCSYEFRSAHSTANPLPSKLVVRIVFSFCSLKFSTCKTIYKNHSTCYDHTGRYNTNAMKLFETFYQTARLFVTHETACQIIFFYN